jgi:hypothetical protein
MRTKNQIIPLRTKPQLVRRQNTNTNIRVIVEPSKGRAYSLNEINKPKPVVIKQAAPVKPAQPINAAVARSTRRNDANRINRKSQVRYISQNIDNDSLAKIKQLKNSGRNRILIIIGNGPSINEVDLASLKTHSNIDTLSINKPDERVWPTTYWAFFDMSQLRRHEDLWNNYNGIIFNSTAIKRQREMGLQVKNLGGKGFSKDLIKGLHIGRSSVYAAMQIGLWMNYEHIYIFGCDMNPDGMNGRLHFYGTNPDVKPEVRKERFKKEAEYYEFAADILKDEDRKRYTFCSSENKWPFVDRYNKLEHKKAISHIIDHSAEIVDK